MDAAVRLLSFLQVCSFQSKTLLLSSPNGVAGRSPATTGDFRLSDGLDICHDKGRLTEV